MEQEGEFLAGFPSYYLITPPCAFDAETKKVVIHGRNNYIVDHVGNQIYVLAFSERDLAKEFICKNKLCGDALIGELDHPDRLAELLLGIEQVRGGPANVVFDKSTSFRGFRISRAEVVGW